MSGASDEQAGRLVTADGMLAGILLTSGSAWLTLSERMGQARGR